MIEWLAIMLMLSMVGVVSWPGLFPRFIVELADALGLIPEPPAPPMPTSVRFVYGEDTPSAWKPRPRTRSRAKRDDELGPNEVAGIVYEDEQPDGTWKARR